MVTETGWTEKAKEDWAKFRTAFEANIPGADTSTPEEIARIREDRRQFMDYVEDTYAGMSDPTLMEEAKYDASSRIIGRGCDEDAYYWSPHCAIMTVLESRGYDISELEKRWHAEAVARVKTAVDAMISEGEPLEGMVRAVVAQATNEETGEVDWARMDNNLCVLAWRHRMRLDPRTIRAIVGFPVASADSSGRVVPPSHQTLPAPQEPAENPTRAMEPGYGALLDKLRLAGRSLRNPATNSILIVIARTKWRGQTFKKLSDLTLEQVKEFTEVLGNLVDLTRQ